MGIDKIKLGPKSRVLEKQARDYEAAVDKVISDALASPAAQAKLEKMKVDLLTQGRAEVSLEPEDFVALHPPLPGPANPQSLRGCGCGKFHIPPEAIQQLIVAKDGVVHRYSSPCYSEDPEGKRTYYNMTKRPSVEDRLTALEKIVTELLIERQDVVDADGEAGL